MLGGSVPGLLASSGDNTAAAASAHVGGGGGNGNGNGELGVGGVIVSNSASSLFGDELQDKGDRSSGGNRWPRQETLALLKIRSDMDVVFRDSSLKGPLWDDVSRKMAELGFHRSAKKCKEKFENVYKYHKRTKDGRATKQDGKSYRFFDQLEALDHHHSSLLPSLPPPPPLPPPPTTPKPQVPPAVVASTTMAAMPVGSSAHPLPTIISHVTVPSTTNPTVASMSLNNSTTITPLLPPITNPTISFPPAAAIPITQSSIPSSVPNMHANVMSNYTSSSSTSSDEQFQGRNKRKRKWKEFFERLMNEVVEKQEKLQKRFLEAIEKREHDRMVREESWKMQEMARMNREHEILVQERSMAAAKDAAVIAFLQKISEQQTPTVQVQVQAQPTPVAQAQIVLNENTSSVMSRQTPKHHQSQPQQQQQITTPPPLPPPPVPQAKVIKDIVKFDNGGSIPSPSRWPKAEVQALINLRTSLDLKYQENGPKGPLWEDISSGMSKIGYNRSAKRCKEKWENINKYFKKVKESNKRRPQDSKTCPYFHLLDALYKEKNKYDPTSLTPPSYGLATVKPDDQNPMAALPLMVQPEQQWPLQQDQPQQRHLEEDGDENENMGQNQGGEEEEEEEEEDGDEDDDLDDDDDEDDEGGGGYEIVSNKPANYNTVSNVE